MIESLIYQKNVKLVERIDITIMIITFEIKILMLFVVSFIFFHSTNISMYQCTELFNVYQKLTIHR